MQQKNLGTVLGIALVVALLATGIFYGLFVGRPKAPASGKSLVVAAKALEAGTVLGQDNVRVVGWAAEELPQGAFTKAEQVTGKTIFAALSAGEPILGARLQSDSGSGAVIPTGMRAISVRVSDSAGVIELLRPGYKVDVQAFVPENEEGFAQLRTALEDVEVLSVNPKPEANSQGFSLPEVTLLAKPGDADLLALADSSARLRLTLRNSSDPATRSRAAWSLPMLMLNR
jgi:pilus assembly protein CpaB